MPPKQRQIRVEQRGGLEAIQALEQRSDEELESETKYKSAALAERRAGDLKDAVERLGQAPPSGRQMLALRAMGLLIPPSSAGILARVRGIVLILVLIVALIAIGLGLVELISLPFGGL